MSPPVDGAAGEAGDREALVAALLDATAALWAAVSSYEHFVGRHDKRGRRDPLFSTRYADMLQAVERAQAVCRTVLPNDEGRDA